MYEEPSFRPQQVNNSGSMAKFVKTVVLGAVVVLVVMLGLIFLLTSGDDTNEAADLQPETNTTQVTSPVSNESESEPEINEEPEPDPETQTPTTLVSRFDHDSYNGKYLAIELWDIEMPLEGAGFLQFYRSGPSRLELSSEPLRDIVGDECSDEDVYVDRGEADDSYQGTTFSQAFESAPGDSIALAQVDNYYYMYTPGSGSCDAGDTSTVRQQLINLATGIRRLDSAATTDTDD